jgi:hypothetical protein
MSTGHSQFVGTAGQFYLAYSLSIRNINASITLGNAPSVDVIASSDDGRYSLNIQVKTSRNAYRNNRYGHPGYEWDVGSSVIGKYRESFWYALIDLKEKNNSWNPKVFFIPSRWIAEFVKPNFSRKMYYLSSIKDDFKSI